MVFLLFSTYTPSQSTNVFWGNIEVIAFPPSLKDILKNTIKGLHMYFKKEIISPGIFIFYHKSFLMEYISKVHTGMVFHPKRDSIIPC